MGKGTNLEDFASERRQRPQTQNCPDKTGIGSNLCFPRCICRALRDCQMQSQGDKLRRRRGFLGAFARPCRNAKRSRKTTNSAEWRSLLACRTGNLRPCTAGEAPLPCRPSHHVGTLLTLTTLGAKPEDFAVSLKLPAAQIRNMGRGAWSGERETRSPSTQASERFGR